jgi:hypothetical protein
MSDYLEQVLSLLIMDDLLSNSEHEFSNSESATSPTEPGPGMVLGRILQSFGEIVQRGMDKVIAKGKIHAALKMFPHDNKLISKDLEEAYDVLLEVSRCVFKYILCSCRALN